MKISLLVAAVAMPILLSACATSQPLVHDDVDRLFLKYAEIAQRPSPMTPDEAEGAAKITGRIRTSTDTCLARKFLKLFPMARLAAAGSPTAPLSDAELQNKKAEAKQYLKGLQNAAPSGNNCPYSGFPPVEIK
ncbi:MAG TPA: hypothetical protein VM659_13370 [Dongiaceae bacterium]|nr:hypothetical protein [Dongiaceae bacterium]